MTIYSTLNANYDHSLLLHIGEESLNCKYLAIQRSPRDEAKNAVVDIRVYKAKVDPPDTYRKLGA